MLIIPCGLPFSGKSTAIDLLDLPAALIRPSDWLPENLEPGTDVDQLWQINCWEVGLDMLSKEVTKPGQTVIFDACNSRYHTLASSIGAAKRAGHKIVLLFVNAPSAICAERAGKKWIGSELCLDYIDRFKISLPKYKEVCTLFLVINNAGTLDDLKQALVSVRDQLCHLT